MPVFPGQLRYIRKNLYHAVYVLDPATVCGLEASFICQSNNWISVVHCIADEIFNIYFNNYWNLAVN